MIFSLDATILPLACLSPQFHAVSGSGVDLILRRHCLFLADCCLSEHFRLPIIRITDSDPEMA